MKRRFKLVSILTLICLIIGSLLWSAPSGIQPVLAASQTEYGGFLYAWSGSKYLIQNQHPAGGNAIDVTSSSTTYEEFNILAPKDGIVVDFEDRFPRTQGVAGCPSNYADFTNYVLLGHGPLKNGEYQTYTLYYHLKQGTVAGSGISKGMFVRLGQKIGDAGDTGAWNNVIHLHMDMSRDPKESLHRDLNCNGVNLTDTHYYYFDLNSSIPIGFEEAGNQWPLLDGGTGNLTSFNWIGIQQNTCDPTNSATKVVLYNHIDYGGECINVLLPENGYSVPSGMHISSIYLNPTWIHFTPYYYHTLTLSDAFSLFKVINASVSDLTQLSDAQGNWNDRITYVHNAAHSEVPWLLEESYIPSGLFDVNIHIRVANDPDFEAWRVCFNGQNCQENAAPINELYYTWNSFQYDGYIQISIWYRRTSDNGNWNNADYYEMIYYNPNRSAFMPCGTNLQGGGAMKLVSGNDCIYVVQDVADLAQFGWGDRDNLLITPINVYIMTFDSPNYSGSNQLICQGENVNVGSSVSSIQWSNTLYACPGIRWSNPTATLTAAPTYIFPSYTPTLISTATFTPTSTALPPTDTFTLTPSGPMTLTFTPSDDVTIRSTEGTTNFGSSTSLEVDNDPYQNFLLKYNVTGVTGTVTNAKIRLYNTNASEFGGSIYRVTDNNWDEGTVTYNTRPSYDSSTVYSSVGAVSVGNWYEWDVTSLVTGNGTYSVRIKSISANGADYSSKEGSNSPQLVITYSGGPSPTATATVVPTVTLTPTLVPTVTVTSATSTPGSGVELLTQAWNLSGNNGADEEYKSIPSNVLNGKTYVRVTYNLHGLTALGGDASALIFDQNGWQYVSLSNYGQNGLNGVQTVEIPISAFMSLNPNSAVGTLHVRFWYSGPFTVDITSVYVH